MISPDFVFPCHELAFFKVEVASFGVTPPPDQILDLHMTGRKRGTEGPGSAPAASLTRRTRGSARISFRRASKIPPQFDEPTTRWAA